MLPCPCTQLHTDLDSVGYAFVDFTSVGPPTATKACNGAATDLAHSLSLSLRSWIIRLVNFGLVLLESVLRCRSQVCQPFRIVPHHLLTAPPAVQGVEALIERFRNSVVMTEPEEHRPRVSTASSSLLASADLLHSCFMLSLTLSPACRCLFQPAIISKNSGVPFIQRKTLVCHPSSYIQILPC